VEAKRLGEYCAKLRKDTDMPYFGHGVCYHGRALSRILSNSTEVAMSPFETPPKDRQRQENESRFAESYVAKYERIIKAAGAMTRQEKHALELWELENITGDGNLGTSDWPGWDEVISRISH
jgi:hypothetical protein